MNKWLPLLAPPVRHQAGRALACVHCKKSDASRGDRRLRASPLSPPIVNLARFAGRNLRVALEFLPGAPFVAGARTEWNFPDHVSVDDATS